MLVPKNEIHPPSTESGYVLFVGGSLDMKILVIGGGGREHAICWKLSQSKDVRKVYCAPGNAGTAAVAENVEIPVTDIAGLVQFAQHQQIDLTIVGPEKPLILGVVDAFEAAGLRIFGPTAENARLEGSKVFSKQLMKQAGVPTAPFEVFDTAAAALDYLAAATFPIVIKADGDAAGKGVIVAASLIEGQDAIKRIMVDREFGASGDKVVIEACLTGPEASLMAFVDGDTVVPMLLAQDHKRIGEGDTGPNTGGMGAYGPVPGISQEEINAMCDVIIKPAVRAIKSTGIPYRGVLFAGIMLTPDGPMCLEYNCRFGDPETEIVLPLLETDLVEVINACVDARLDQISVAFSSRSAVTVVLAAHGYPGAVRTGDVITGLEDAAKLDAVAVFHAGTRFSDDGAVLSSGGRVLTVTATGDSFQEARQRAYTALDRIHLDGGQYRRDIGWRAVQEG
jgi:phosphoribosylamine--glycine ligase